MQPRTQHHMSTVSPSILYPWRGSFAKEFWSRKLGIQGGRYDPNDRKDQIKEAYSVSASEGITGSDFRRYDGGDARGDGGGADVERRQAKSSKPQQRRRDGVGAVQGGDCGGSCMTKAAMSDGALSRRKINRR